MSSEEAKRIVCEGLERRRTEQQIAAREAQLEQYEQDMIDTCNEHCADVKLQRRNEETGRLHRERAEARRAAKAEAQAKEQARTDAAIDAVMRYGYACLGIAMVATWTSIEWWAAAALAAGLAVFPAVYVFRLYYPIGEN